MFYKYIVYLMIMLKYNIDFVVIFFYSIMIILQVKNREFVLIGFIFLDVLKKIFFVIELIFIVIDNGEFFLFFNYIFFFLIINIQIFVVELFVILLDN